MFTRKRLLMTAAISLLAGLALAITGYSKLFPRDTHIILITLSVICFLLSNIAPKE